MGSEINWRNKISLSEALLSANETVAIASPRLIGDVFNLVTIVVSSQAVSGVGEKRVSAVVER